MSPSFTRSHALGFAAFSLSMLGGVAACESTPSSISLTSRKPSNRYCYVGATCEGGGCT